MQRMFTAALWIGLGLVLAGAPAPPTLADEAAKPAGNSPGNGAADAAGGEAKPSGKTLAADPPGMKRLLPDANAWIDGKNHRVVIDGVVCLRNGTLEMLACLTNTKEHESVVAVDVPAHVIHAALMAVGAKPGSPAKFRPEFSAAHGTPIDITMVWQDEKKQRHTARAQEWVRNVRTNKALESDWVFAGSSMFTDDKGKQHYQAEGGDLICVSNFPTAMLDLPVESSQATADLMFEAFTENIPPVGTKVRLVLRPRLENDKEKEMDK
ncbi:MAG TPA: YdjY domain-containing protein [Pirellulales bacterium]|nr:YdjY domain-containing protein [Pirellulales bacterium]